MPAHSDPRGFPLYIYREPALIRLIGVSRSTLWRWCRTGLFPAPIRLGPNSVGWRRTDVEAWLDSRSPSIEQSVPRGGVGSRA